MCIINLLYDKKVVLSIYSNIQNCCRQAAESTGPRTLSAEVGLLAALFVGNFDICYRQTLERSGKIFPFSRTVFLPVIF